MLSYLAFFALIFGFWWSNCERCCMSRGQWNFVVFYLMHHGHVIVEDSYGTPR